MDGMRRTVVVVVVSKTSAGVFVQLVITFSACCGALARWLHCRRWRGVWLPSRRVFSAPGLGVMRWGDGNWLEQRIKTGGRGCFLLFLWERCGTGQRANLAETELAWETQGGGRGGASGGVSSGSSLTADHGIELHSSLSTLLQTPETCTEEVGARFCEM
ncbi:hypothetical protein EDC01DRAFT_490349 [Geopyxis carbonaria]|nr:hypothetical protein EDC01DRAFT_490349 [Geopyxis carbonaria]